MNKKGNAGIAFLVIMLLFVIVMFILFLSMRITHTDANKICNVSGYKNVTDMKFDFNTLREKIECDNVVLPGEFSKTTQRFRYCDRYDKWNVCKDFEKSTIRVFSVCKSELICVELFRRDKNES